MIGGGAAASVTNVAGLTQLTSHRTATAQVGDGMALAVTRNTSSNTSTHTFDITNKYSTSITADITISETGLSVSKTGVSIASDTTNQIDIDAAHLDTVTPTVNISDSSQNVTASPTLSVPGPATGGTESIRVEQNGNLYDIHAFESTGTNTFEVNTVPSSGSVDALLVGGGGGGAGSPHAGGGGAGGLLFEQGISVSAQQYTISVGDGGAGKVGAGDDDGYSVDGLNQGKDGEDTTAFDLTALGGGGGGGYDAGGDPDQPGRDGGSGGGGAKGAGENAFGAALQPGSTDGGSGNDGGVWGGYPNTNDYAGGGGGAGEAGSSGGDGGDGADYSAQFSSAFGENGYFAGGGGGAIYGSGPADGGLGGGGKGDANNMTDASKLDAQDFTGGGGGGAERRNGILTGGDGGAGVVLVRYQVPV